MPGKWCGSKVRPTMADNSGLDDDAALGRRTTHGQCGTTPTARSTGPAARAPTKRAKARALRNLEHPPGQRLGLLPAGPSAITHATRPDLKIVIAHRDMVRTKGDGSRSGRIAGLFRVIASRSKIRMALESKDFCTSQPPQPAALLSRHPPETSPFATHLPHNSAPIDAVTRQRDKWSITANGSSKRARRGRSRFRTNREWRSATRRRRSCRARLPLRHRGRRTAAPGSS